jgi:chromosome partitioning protein
VKTVAFFNNKGGVGKTSLVYHLAWMFSEKGIPTLAVDLDPQSNLTAMFLDEQRLEQIWPDGEHPETIYGAIRPIMRGTGDINETRIIPLNDNLGLIAGDLGLSRFEDKLSIAWPNCQLQDEAAFRTMTAFHRVVNNGAGTKFKLILIDVGPNLGAINRAALIASDHICIPLAPDLFSLQGLKNLGPTLGEWRNIWNDLKSKGPTDISLPTGTMESLGYIVMQHGINSTRPTKAHQRWINKIPSLYQDVILEVPGTSVLNRVEEDSNCLSLLKHYRSLMPMAVEARKPIFFLKSADGAIGSHTEAVASCYRDFENLARRIGDKLQIVV